MLQILINSLASGATFLLVGLGFSLLYNTVRFFNFSQAFVITSGAYAMFVTVIIWRAPLWMAIIIGASLASAIGATIEIYVFRQLRLRRVSSWGLLLTSLSGYLILQNTISLLFDDVTRSVRLGAVQVGHEVGGAYITDIQLLAIFVSMIVLFFVMFVLRTTSFGLAIRGISSNPELSVNFGISAERTILLTTLFSSALAAFAGMLSALDTDMTPTMGFRVLINGIIAMIISGVGSYPSLVGGAFILAMSQHTVVYYFGSQWMDAVSFIILIAFLSCKPLGFSGRRLKKIEI